MAKKLRIRIENSEIRPASAVTVFGRIAGDISMLKKMTSGAAITIEKSADG
ncbi:MAG: hypothetical protein JXA46_18455 [Dehalococcoidales bacterium]|nr:hypothetical protein [Dehalococcoidales bacterium]